MNDNLRRHRILKVLSKKLIENDVASVNGERSGTWAVPFKTIAKNIGCSELKIRQAVSVLLENKEIFLYSMEFIGLGAEEAGLSAYSTKKYLWKFKSDLTEILKDAVQIFIPVISMIITLVAVSNSDSKKIGRLETKLQEMQIVLTRMEESIKKPTYNRVKPTNISFEKDSLNTK